MLMRDKSISQMEDRLSTLTGKGDKSEGSLAELTQIIAQTKGEGKGVVDSLFAKWFNLPRLFCQADVTMSVSKFMALCLGVGVVGFMITGIAGVSLALAPVVGIMFAMLPLFWLTFRRKRRLKKFAAQLPEALNTPAGAKARALLDKTPSP